MLQRDIEVAGVTLGRTHPLVVETLDTGTLEWRNQDVEHPREDRMVFGRDYLTPSVWTLSVVTNSDDVPAGLDALNRLEQVWRNNRRERPGWYLALSYERAGEVRTVYGRPRKFARAVSPAFAFGLTRATLEFQLLDTFSYGLVDSSDRLTVIPGEAGGLIFPVVFPWGSRPGGPRQGVIDIGGTTATPVTVKIHGPVSSPVVTGPGWRLAFPGLTLAYDQQVTVDPRAQSATRSDGASMVGKMSRFYFDELTLPPGRHEITFEGVDQSGSGWAQVSWREAFIGF